MPNVTGPFLCKAFPGPWRDGSSLSQGGGGPFKAAELDIPKLLLQTLSTCNMELSFVERRLGQKELKLGASYRKSHLTEGLGPAAFLRRRLLLQSPVSRALGPYLYAFSTFSEAECFGSSGSSVRHERIDLKTRALGHIYSASWGKAGLQSSAMRISSWPT